MDWIEDTFEGMIISESQPPPLSKDGSETKWERGADPWHVDAFPTEFKHLGTMGPRMMGWLALDWCGNVIGWLADGTEYKEGDIGSKIMLSDQLE